LAGGFWGGGGGGGGGGPATLDHIWLSTLDSLRKATGFRPTDIFFFFGGALCGRFRPTARVQVVT
jgi:hypothetical protein